MTSRLHLPTVTLVCVDCLDAEAAWWSIDQSTRGVEFADVKLLTSLPTGRPHVPVRRIASLEDYSGFVLKRLHEHVSTEHMLIVQHDGWIINPASWDPDWLRFDYCAPVYRQHPVSDASVGAGGFSLRSARLMRRTSQIMRHMPEEHFVGYEDAIICGELRAGLAEEGFRFMPATEAVKFCFGDHPDEWPGAPLYFERPFGFHQIGKEHRVRLGVDEMQ